LISLTGRIDYVEELENLASPKHWTVDELSACGDKLAETLGLVIAANAEGRQMSRKELAAARRVILIWRRIAFQATHPGARA
jgi:hypothetical protein